VVCRHCDGAAASDLPRLARPPAPLTARRAPAERLAGATHGGGTAGNGQADALVET
jgi:hypothetical protein